VSDRSTDEQLLERANLGDRTAFLELYEKHRGRILAFAYRMLGSVELAEDITHDCFVSLINNSSRFDPSRAPLRSYLFAAARNLALKHFNKKSRESSIEDLPEEFDPPVIEEQPLGRLISAELSAEVRRVIMELPPLQREVLLLFEYEELSLAEIAIAVSADVGTVKARLHRARERLRKNFSHYFAGAQSGC
jgi:RNA polymerase sigma-70 factor, ECF subfamily